MFDVAKSVFAGVAQQITDQVHDVKMIDKNERASTIKVILVEKLGK
jgi:hypothetical protein